MALEGIKPLQSWDPQHELQPLLIDIYLSIQRRDEGFVTWADNALLAAQIFSKVNLSQCNKTASMAFCLQLFAEAIKHPTVTGKTIAVLQSFKTEFQDLVKQAIDPQMMPQFRNQFQRLQPAFSYMPRNKKAVAGFPALIGRNARAYPSTSSVRPLFGKAPQSP